MNTRYNCVKNWVKLGKTMNTRFNYVKKLGKTG